MKEFASEKTYDQLAQRYEKYCQKYWCKYGAQMVERLDIQPGQHVLDMAAGTGSSAIPAARRVGPAGKVTAVDSSRGMLELAADKARAQGLHNIDVVVGDMRTAELPLAHFDHVVSAFGLFFVRDMPSLVTRFWNLVRPGGSLTIAVWGTQFLAPVHGHWRTVMQQARPDIKVELPWERIHERNLGDVMSAGGVAGVHVDSEIAMVELKGPDHWWDIVLSTGLSRFLEYLTPEARESVRAENAAWIREHDMTRLSIDVAYATATKPETST